MTENDMDLKTDFNYLAVTIDKSREYQYNSPINYEMGASDESKWRNLYPVAHSFDKELMKFPISYNNRQLQGYIRHKSRNIWLLTEIDLDIIKSFIKGAYNSWERKPLQPFFFHTYKK
jgi:hypothetical protein